MRMQRQQQSSGMSSAGSLAAATSSRVDSASKHIQPCRVNEEYMLSLLEGFVDNPQTELQNNKMKYCMHKDEIVVGLGRPKYGSSSINSRKKAYPPVITNLARMQDFARRWLAVHNFIAEDAYQVTATKNKVVQALTGNNGSTQQEEILTISKQLEEYQDSNKRGFIREQIKNSVELYFVGVALGQAYAHHNSGDTVASVMIGGLRTVQNGAFAIHTNDLLMFYFDDELPLFEESGSRVNRTCLQERGKSSLKKIVDFCSQGEKSLTKTDRHTQPNEKAGLRKQFYDKGNGNFPGGDKMKINIFRIKPYIVSRHREEDGITTQHFPCDKARIWGRAISNAQPWEMVDVQLSRQAI